MDALDQVGAPQSVSRTLDLITFKVVEAVRFTSPRFGDDPQFGHSTIILLLACPQLYFSLACAHFILIIRVKAHFVFNQTDFYRVVGPWLATDVATPYSRGLFDCSKPNFH